MGPYFCISDKVEGMGRESGTSEIQSVYLISWHILQIYNT